MKLFFSISISKTRKKTDNEKQFLGKDEWIPCKNECYGKILYDARTGTMCLYQKHCCQKNPDQLLKILFKSVTFL